MGHANYSNLCNLWVNLLYAKGRLTIGQAVEVAGKRGEKLQASEGAYDADTGMVGMALTEYVYFLAGEEKWWRGGESWGGPYIRTDFSPLVWEPKSFLPSGDLANMLSLCSNTPDDADLHAVTADKIRDEAGPETWAEFVRDLPKIRAAHLKQCANEADDDEDWQLTDRVPWVFRPGWRKRYKDVPRMSSVTH